MLLFSIFTGPPTVEAHLAGQPSFIQINGKDTNTYPLSAYSSLPELTLPHDIAKDTVVINQSVTFNVNTQPLEFVLSKDVIDSTKFLWDSGDTKKKEGRQLIFVYPSEGPYSVRLYADTSAFTPGVAPQLLQSVLLHVVPSLEYHPPKPVVRINRIDAASEVMVRIPGEVHFDASDSQSSSPIKSYLWDFGDGSSASGAVISHQFNDAFDSRVVGVRITDEKGFYTDAVVTLNPSARLPVDKIVVYAVSGVVILFVLIILLRFGSTHSTVK